MEHSRRREHDHRAGVVDVPAVERLDVLEVEHVAMDEGLSDLLVGPRDEHFVIIVRLLGQAQREVDRELQVHSLPVSLEEDAKLLRAAQRKDGNQNFTAARDALVDLLEEVGFAAPLRVADRGRIGRFGDEQVGLALVDPGRSQVPVRCHVVVAGVHDRLVANTDPEHCCAQDVSGVICFDLHLTVDHHRLVERHGRHLLHTVFNHLRCEEVGLAFSLHGNLSHVFQQNRSDGLRWMCHVDGTCVADHFRHVRKRT